MIGGHIRIALYGQRVEGLCEHCTTHLRMDITAGFESINTLMSWLGYHSACAPKLPEDIDPRTTLYAYTDPHHAMDGD